MLYRMPTQFPFRAVIDDTRLTGFLYNHNSIFSELLELYAVGKLDDSSLESILKDNITKSEFEDIYEFIGFLKIGQVKTRGNENWFWLKLPTDALEGKRLHDMFSISETVLEGLISDESSLYYEKTIIEVANKDTLAIIGTIFKDLKLGGGVDVTFDC